MSYTSTLIASEGSLIVSSNKIPSIPGHVANLLAIPALYSARPIVVQLALVSQRAYTVGTFSLPLVPRILCYFVFLPFDLAHLLASHAGLCLIDSNSLNSISNSLGYNLLDFRKTHPLIRI
ncbi:hypothetical protein Tco_0652908 [Tanacetum coccineum]|uniref:Uncharacterized protein n=1 Tax=Tanacetum coccineum TaxID=301880 RepID=A0ABQ4WYW6_9ASTR